MEEGELPEEGEISDDDQPVVENCGAGRPTSWAEGRSESRDAKSYQKLDEENDGTERAEDGVQALINKRRLELAETVKSRLQFGVENNDDYDWDNEGESPPPSQPNQQQKQQQQPERHDQTLSSSPYDKLFKPAPKTGASVTDGKSPPPNVSYLAKPDKVPSSGKYMDLDRIEDPIEAMISNWARGVKKSSSEKPKKRSHNFASPSHSSGSPSFDPYDDYYGRCSATPPNVDDAGKDQDYRVGAANDQDYRLVGPRKSTNDAPEMNSEESVEVGSDEEMANEFGDIDERRRAGGGSSRKGGSTGGAKGAGAKSGESGATDRRGKRSVSNGSASDADVNNFAENSRGQRSASKSRLKTGRTLKSGSKRSKSPLVPSKRRRPRWERGERPTCKFFKEGYCREGDACVFSHDIEIPRSVADKKPELCKYYAQGFCRNGRRCPFLHSEFPCKYFFKGSCGKGGQCRYSHEKLNDVTKPLYEKMLKEEELASKVSIPDAPSRRKVLLGEPPKSVVQSMHANGPGGSPFHKPSYAPLIAQEPIEALFYPSEKPKGPAEGGALLSTPRNFVDVGHQSSDVSPTAGSGAATKQEENAEPDNTNDGFDATNHDSSKISFDIAAMLRQIKAQVNGDENQESPASPDSGSHQLQFFTVRKPVLTPLYVLHSLDLPPKDLSISAAVLHASLSDEKLRSDPRVKKRLSSQFDAVSNLISSQRSQQDASDYEFGAAVSKDPRFKGGAGDPRMVSRDPRLTKLQSDAVTMPGATHVTDLSDLPASSYAVSSTSVSPDAIPYAPPNVSFGYADVPSLIGPDFVSFPLGGTGKKAALLPSSPITGVVGASGGSAGLLYGGGGQLQAIPQPTYGHQLGPADNRLLPFGQENVPTTCYGNVRAATGSGPNPGSYAPNTAAGPLPNAGWVPPQTNYLSQSQPPQQPTVSTGRAFLIGTGNEIPVRYSYMSGPVVNGPAGASVSSFAPPLGSGGVDLPLKDPRGRRQPLRNMKEVGKPMAPSSSSMVVAEREQDSKANVALNVSEPKSCDSTEGSSSSTAEVSVDTGATAAVAVPSLRERRKDLLYESPLSGAEKSATVSEENRYNQPLTLKLKIKKEADEIPIS